MYNISIKYSYEYCILFTKSRYVLHIHIYRYPNYSYVSFDSCSCSVTPFAIQTHHHPCITYVYVDMYISETCCRACEISVICFVMLMRILPYYKSILFEMNLHNIESFFFSFSSKHIHVSLPVQSQFKNK